jgi:CRISPR/Cas system-associated exonuclease Cas4 (RecB family)
MTLNNEYAEILSYLEAQERPRPAAPARPKPKEKDNRTADRIKETSKKTKQLLDDSIEDYKDLPKVDYKLNKSTTFDVKRIEQMMLSRLIDEYKKQQSYERPYISCSELYRCLRRNYYVRKRYKIDLKKEFSFPYLYLIQKVGNLVHEIVQDLYNFDEVEKTIVSENYKVKGRIDALGGEVVYEIKSIDREKFKGKYKEEHYFQGIIYAHILNTEYNYSIKKVTIIYIIRDLKSIHTFEVDLNDKIAESLLSRSTILLDSLAKNSPPDPIGATMQECKFCSYRSYCTKDKCKTVVQPFAKEQKPAPKEDKKEKQSVFLL